MEGIITNFLAYLSMETEARFLGLKQRSVKDTLYQSEDSMGSSDPTMAPDRKVRRTLHTSMPF